MASEINSDGRLRVIHRNPANNGGGIDLRSEFMLADGKWHCFAITKGDDGIVHLYVDGKLEASSKIKATDFGEKPYQLLLGMNHETNLRYFSGLMDEIRFWDYARTKEQIDNNSRKPIDPKSEGLVAYYDFNQIDTENDVEQSLTSHPSLARLVKDALKLRRESK